MSDPVRNCFPWGRANVQYKNANWTWSECQLVEEIVNIANQPGVDATTLIQPWIEEPWNPYRAADREQEEKKRKRLIKLICRIKGQEYNEEKTPKDFKITVGDIKLVVKAVKDIDLKVKE